MVVSKWGKSLAVRLPSNVVDGLELIVGGRIFKVSRDQRKARALTCLHKLRRPLPPGFVFDREDANAP